MIAVRIQGLGRYFGPVVDFDGATRPREAWRFLLSCAGIHLKELTDQNTQRTRVVGGHVLEDLSLDVEQGTVVCLSGPSGSGKSVLLQILAGILPPTAGLVELFVPATTLISPGAAVDGRMTASENIAAVASEAEMSPEETQRFRDEVLDFAELHGFEDAPLRTYSTGMLIRLGVALVLCRNPRLVLMDDVLAVGDIAFQQKVVDRVLDLKEAGCTIIAALSDDALVHQLATRIVTLGGGRVVSDRPPVDWVHTRETGAAANVAWEVLRDFPEDDVMALTGLDAVARTDGEMTWLDLTLAFRAKRAGTRCRPSISLARGRTAIFRSPYPDFLEIERPRALTFSASVPTHLLAAGKYGVMVNMQTVLGDTVYSMKAQDAVTVTVRRGAAAPDDAAAGEPLLELDAPWHTTVTTVGAA